MRILFLYYHNTNKKRSDEEISKDNNEKKNIKEMIYKNISELPFFKGSRNAKNKYNKFILNYYL